MVFIMFLYEVSKTLNIYKDLVFIVVLYQGNVNRFFRSFHILYNAYEEVVKNIFY